jgi:hypothetical protein
MFRKRWLSLGAVVLLGGVAQAQDRPLFPSPAFPARQVTPTQAPSPQPPPPDVATPAGPEGGSAPETRQQLFGAEEGTPPAEGAYGPTPLIDVKILQNLIFGEDSKPCVRIAGWADFDYTYRSTGSGENNVAPVMNRFGNEALVRQLGLYLFKPLDPKEWSWGFNAIFIAGADAAFLGPTAGGWANTDPRFGSQFTDLNVTAHLPILTEGGVDVKAGRQTTILGPMGALPWQRYFDSSDYAWYNMEEGRYTGVSSVWHISKRLDWYNGVEVGGWGVFYDNPVHGVDYITNVSYWLDEDAKKTKAWFTVLTGPTSFVPGQRGLNTTVVEIGLQQNWTPRVYQILDSQMVYSKAPIFQEVPPSYQERAYDVYTYLGYHCSKTVDLNSRFEWYRDVDGGFYPGGFGKPRTDYFAITLGPDYHPTNCVQFRPEIRYDHATNPNFGPNYDKKEQLSIAAEVLFKF